MMKRCNPCFGSGKLIGLGMVQKPCHHCNGVGKVEPVLPKESQEYEAAKATIQAAGKLSAVEAERILDEEISKQDSNKPVKKGKK